MADHLQPDDVGYAANFACTTIVIVRADREQHLCDGTLCRLIDKFEVPPDADSEEQFVKYLASYREHRDVYIPKGSQAHDQPQVETVEVPSDSESLEEGIEYLASYKDTQNVCIPIGSQSQIQARVDSPCCRLASKILRPHFSAAPQESEFVLVVNVITGIEFDVWRPIPTGGKEVLSTAKSIVVVSSSIPGGGIAGHIVGSEGIDYGRAKQWLRNCDDLHDICPLRDSQRARRPYESSHLRVVDTIQDCLVDIPWHQKYAALSYVWGVTSSSPPKLFRANMEALYMPGALESICSSMPRTIRDAMSFTSAIGLRYLWFDSLCLIQDSPEDLDRGIESMDLVYESAHVTIIAANGPDADCGLPGVGETARRPKQSAQTLKPGLELMSIRGLDYHLNKSKWASRAWT